MWINFFGGHEKRNAVIFCPRVTVSVLLPYVCKSFHVSCFKIIESWLGFELYFNLQVLINP